MRPKRTEPNPTDRPVPYSEGWQSPVTPVNRLPTPATPPSPPESTRATTGQPNGQQGQTGSQINEINERTAPTPVLSPPKTERKSRAADGRFLSDEELSKPDNLELGSAANQKKANKRRVTERTFLRQLVVEANKDDNMEGIVQRLIADAKAGDKDAMKLVSRVLWGGGKVPLDDIYHTPMIRKGRR